MTAVAAYLVVVVAFAALCCGHVGETFPFPLRGAWRGLRASLAAAQHLNAVREVRPPQGAADGHRQPREPSGTPRTAPSWRESAPQTPGGGFPAPNHPGAPEGRTARPAPAWARTDKDTT